MKTTNSIAAAVRAALWAGVVVLSPAGDAAAGPAEFPAVREAGDILVDLGSMQAKPLLGHGWSLSERSAERDYRWIKSMEAELDIQVPEVRRYRLWIEAVAAYLPYTRQEVALLVNGRVAAKFLCAHHPHFAVYQAEVPARLLRPGSNRLILRMGYRTRSAFDPRELSLCVDRLLLRPAEE